MRVGDLVLYNYRVGARKDGQQLGIVTYMNNDNDSVVWWVPIDGGNSTWTHVVNLEVVSESR